MAKGYRRAPACVIFRTAPGGEGQQVEGQCHAERSPKVSWIAARRNWELFDIRPVFDRAPDSGAMRSCGELA
jgi:hypothetical protein